ncbi:hypothetical protein EPN52_01740 [bacterium]|nr:MAG: hypothetical protein EPN52_01740 [bacterium]
MRRRGRGAGFTLAELVVAAGLAALLALAALAPALSSHPLGAATAAARLAQLVDAARVQAAAGGDGATLVFALPASGEGFIATLYRNRPRPGVTLVPGGAEPYWSEAHVALAGIAPQPPFALFVDSTGSVTAAAWEPSQGALPAEPVCTTELQLTIADGGGLIRRSLPCAQATLR